MCRKFLLYTLGLFRNNVSRGEPSSSLYFRINFIRQFYCFFNVSFFVCKTLFGDSPNSTTHDVYTLVVTHLYNFLKVDCYLSVQLSVIFISGTVNLLVYNLKVIRSLDKFSVLVFCFLVFFFFFFVGSHTGCFLDTFVLDG